MIKMARRAQAGRCTTLVLLGLGIILTSRDGAKFPTLLHYAEELRNLGTGHHGKLHVRKMYADLKTPPRFHITPRKSLWTVLVFYKILLTPHWNSHS
jgi:hypothetical protein